MDDWSVGRIALALFGATMTLASGFGFWLRRSARHDALFTPLGFEHHCAAALRDAGWRAELTVATGDQGVDVFARKGAVSVVVQCKLYSKAVGNGAVQEALAGKAFARATFAAVVSNQRYTRSARDLASRTGVLLLAPADLTRADRLFR